MHLYWAVGPVGLRRSNSHALHGAQTPLRTPPATTRILANVLPRDETHGRAPGTEKPCCWCYCPWWQPGLAAATPSQLHAALCCCLPRTASAPPRFPAPLFVSGPAVCLSRLKYWLALASAASCTPWCIDPAAAPAPRLLSSQPCGCPYQPASHQPRHPARPGSKAFLGAPQTPPPFWGLGHNKIFLHVRGFLVLKSKIMPQQCVPVRGTASTTSAIAQAMAFSLKKGDFCAFSDTLPYFTAHPAREQSHPCSDD